MIRYFAIAIEESLCQVEGYLLVRGIYRKRRAVWAIVLDGLGRVLLLGGVGGRRVFRLRGGGGGGSRVFLGRLWVVGEGFGASMRRLGWGRDGFLWMSYLGKGKGKTGVRLLNEYQ